MPETITIPGRAEFVTLARTGIKTMLAAAPADVQDDAALIVDELATNAVLWSRSGRGGSVQIVLHHERGSSTARIEVTDDGALSAADRAVTQTAREVADCGEQYQRGLDIVAALTKDWGQESKGGRGIYWAVLSWS